MKSRTASALFLICAFFALAVHFFLFEMRYTWYVTSSDYWALTGGYAACAYSVAAPGAQVLALNPRATLDPAQTAGDRRDLAARKLDFTSRYGYAPDMLEGAAQVFVIHDPTSAAEAAQAALFRASYITRLSARHMGDGLAGSFDQMGLLPALAGRMLNQAVQPSSFVAPARQEQAGQKAS